MEAFLATLMAALMDAFGQAAVRAACDTECEIRKGRASATANAEHEFGSLPPDTLPGRPPEQSP